MPEDRNILFGPGWETLRDSIFISCDSIGAEGAQRVRDLINVPVEGSGFNAIRSKPGEPPRKDSGDLYASIESDTVLENDIVTTTVSAGTYYATKLEYDLNRPYITTMFEEQSEKLLNQLADDLNHNLK